MQTLSYGFLLPSTGDKGPSVFPALATNIQKLNDHNHDGQNSAQIPAYSLQSAQSTILNSAWASYGGPVGFYRQLVTMAPGYTFDTDNMSFRSLTGDYVYPKIEKQSDTTYLIYSNDPGITLKVNYGG